MSELERLEALATTALRKNQPRRFQCSWEQASECPSAAELEYIRAASPVLILRLIRRSQRATQ